MRVQINLRFDFWISPANLLINNNNNLIVVPASSVRFLIGSIIKLV